MSFGGFNRNSGGGGRGNFNRNQNSGGGGRFNSGRGGGGRGGRGGGGGGRGGFKFVPEGPPEQVIPFAHFTHPCQNDLVLKVEIEDVPYFNAPVYLENKESVGKIDEIFGNLRDYYVSVKLSNDLKAGSFKRDDKFYLDPAKILPLARFLPQPPGQKRGGGSRGGGVGGRGGGSRGRGHGGSRGRGRGGGGGGRGGFSGRGGGGRGGRGGFGGRGGGGGGRGGFRR